MSRRTRVDEHDSTTESKFYLPAGGTPSSEAGRFERVWSTLFGRRI